MKEFFGNISVILDDISIIIQDIENIDHSTGLIF